MLKQIILSIFLFSCSSAFAATDSTQLLQAIFQSETQPLNTDLDEIDISLAAASTIRGLGSKGYYVGVQIGGSLKSIEFKELEKKGFDVPGALTIIAEDNISLKASVRLYLNATDDGKPVSEAANVYVFIYAEKSNGKLYIKRVDVDFKGLS